jgi:hypothetical protein
MIVLQDPSTSTVISTPVSLYMYSVHQKVQPYSLTAPVVPGTVLVPGSIVELFSDHSFFSIR